MDNNYSEFLNSIVESAKKYNVGFIVKLDDGSTSFYSKSKQSLISLRNMQIDDIYDIIFDHMHNKENQDMIKYIGFELNFDYTISDFAKYLQQRYEDMNCLNLDNISLFNIKLTDISTTVRELKK